MDSPTIDRSEVMARRFALVEEIAIIEGRHKAELAEKKEELDMCETYIRQTMLEAKEQQIKFDGIGMTYFIPKDSATVQDMDAVISTILRAAPPPPNYTPEQWDAALAHVQTHGLWPLLNKAVNKTTVKEMIEAQTPPAGVKYESYRDLAWRRGK